MDVTTIFITAFPTLTLTDSDFNLIFTFAQGFEGFLLNHGQKICFAKFRTKEDAVYAIKVLNNMVCGDVVLKAELAKKNLVLKKLTPHSNGQEYFEADYETFLPSNLLSDSSFEHDKLGDLVEDAFNGPKKLPFDPNASNGFECALYHSLESLNLPSGSSTGGLSGSSINWERDSPLTLSSSNMSLNHLSPPTSALLGNSTVVPCVLHLSNNSSQSSSMLHNGLYRPKPLLSDQNNPPCNTLYVGNLPINAQEEELRSLFSTCIGYKRMCFKTKNITNSLNPSHYGPMCFVEFETIEYATKAMNEMYGKMLSNSTKGKNSFLILRRN